MSVDQITLYTAKICPFAHRVELALEEAKAGYSRCEIDLANKPEWYAPQVNPASKLSHSISRHPSSAFGGPQVPPEQPSPESTKIAESLILVEFTPVQRAKFLPAYMGPVARGQAFEPLWDALEEIQKLLPADKPYAIGDEYTAADIAITPFLARMEVWLKNDIGAYKAGEGKKAAEYFYSCDRFARLVKYYETIKGRESFKATFHPEVIKEKYTARFAPLRAQQAATVTAAA
ncbi:serine carboxypeptidase [Favolaschia claudopus]|uniref:Serine carboxypeptidase n=1 Tax=Favolaschia claudopus TaxID=2862362 RepID=A0AAW0E7Y4_9AGAR